MKSRTENKRSIIITFRLSASEHVALSEAADRANLPPSTFVRNAALGTPIKIQSYLRFAPEDIAELKRLGNLLNQIARAMWRGRFLPSTEEHLAVVLCELRAALRHMLAQYLP